MTRSKVQIPSLHVHFIIILYLYKKNNNLNINIKFCNSLNLKAYSKHINPELLLRGSSPNPRTSIISLSH